MASISMHRPNRTNPSKVFFLDLHANLPHFNFQPDPDVLSTLHHQKCIPMLPLIIRTPYRKLY